MSKYSIKPPEGKYTAVPEGYDTSYETMDSPDMSNYERWESWGDVKHGVGQAFRPFKEVGDYFLPIEETSQIIQGQENPLLMALGFVPGLKQVKKVYNKIPGGTLKHWEVGNQLMGAGNAITGNQTVPDLSILPRVFDAPSEYEKEQNKIQEQNDKIKAYDDYWFK